MAIYSEEIEINLMKKEFISAFNESLEHNNICNNLEHKFNYFVEYVGVLFAVHSREIDKLNEKIEKLEGLLR